MTEHDDELASRLTDYLQGYASYPRPATVERRQRRWPAAVAAALAAVIAAGAITGGYFALRPGPVAPGGAAGPVRLLFETYADSVANCASSPYSTLGSGPGTSPVTCNFATMPLEGGGLQGLSTENGPDLQHGSGGLLYGPVLVGSQVLTLPTGSGVSSATPNEVVSGFYVLDLATDTWRHVALATSVAVAPSLTSVPGDVPFFTSGMSGVLSPRGGEVALPTDTGAPGLDVIDLSTGAVEWLTPALPAGFAINAWLADGIHVSAPCADSTNGGGLCGYVMDPVTGALTRLSSEDGWVAVLGSPDGTQEVVTPASAEGAKVVAGPVGGPLKTIYTAPAGEEAFTIDIGDDGSVLTSVGSGSSWQEVILAGGAATTATPPKGGWAPAGMAPDPVFALPGGGFVAVVWTGPGPSVQELVRVMPDGSTSVIGSVPNDTAQLIGLAG